MSINYTKRVISHADVAEIIGKTEDWIMDMKGKEIKPAKLSKTISAFANTNGGDLFVGISHQSDKRVYYWNGYTDEESFNPIIALLDNMLPTYDYYSVEAYQHPDNHTYILHIIVHKTINIIYASDGKPYVRHGVQNLPCDTAEKMLRLKLDKGMASYEDEFTQSVFDDIKNSSVLFAFLSVVAPQTAPYDWLRKQRVMDGNAKINVAGVLLYDECPQATLPKQSAIRILRYRTDDTEGQRNNLVDGFPISIEGDVYSLIRTATSKIKEIVENTGVIGHKGNELRTYPDTTLHEIITNAVIHRDYSIPKDIQIRIFTNRIEVESPGKLPGHITLENILREQYSRNPKLIRLISKFPDPPNKDVGEGLNTAFHAMLEMKLKPPIIEETDNSVIVTIRHERLDDAESVVLEYLDAHDTISNSIARGLTGITDTNKMKKVFYVLKEQGLLEIVPGTRGSATLWRATASCPQTSQPTEQQISLFDSYNSTLQIETGDKNE